MMQIGGIQDVLHRHDINFEMQESSGIKFKLLARYTRMLNLMLALIIALLGVAILK